MNQPQSVEHIELSEDPLDLRQKYGPIGLKAVASACLQHRSNVGAKPTLARDIDIDLVARLSRVAEPGPQGSE